MDLAAAIQEARSMLVELKSTRAPDRVAALLDSLAFLQGSMQSEATSLQQQCVLADLLAAQHEDGGAALSRADVALDAGDVAYLAMLDLTDARLSARTRVAVANVFARPECKGSVGFFRRAVEVHLGAGVLTELQRVGMA